MIYYAKLLQDGTVYDKKNIYIKYYTEEQFAKYKSTANLLGSINLKPELVGNNTDSLVVENQTTKTQFKLKPLNRKDKVFGYIYVGDNNFIRILKPFNKLLLLLIPLILIFIVELFVIIF